jgi:hypothetical protein
VAHPVPEGQSAQAPAWHVPSAPHVVAAVTGQSARGSALPLLAAAQVPSAPPVFAAEHAWQALPHAVSQHTPSTQNPLWHAAAVAQAAPGAPLEPEDEVLLVDALEDEVLLVDVLELEDEALLVDALLLACGLAPPEPPPPVPFIAA